MRNSSLALVAMVGLTAVSGCGPQTVELIPTDLVLYQNGKLRPEAEVFKLPGTEDLLIVFDDRSGDLPKEVFYLDLNAGAVGSPSMSVFKRQRTGVYAAKTVLRGCPRKGHLFVTITASHDSISLVVGGRLMPEYPLRRGPIENSRITLCKKGEAPSGDAAGRGPQ